VFDGDIFHLYSLEQKFKLDQSPMADGLSVWHCGWSVGPEFPAGQLAESDYWREQFQTISEDVSVRNANVLMHSAHRGLGFTFNTMG